MNFVYKYVDINNSWLFISHGIYYTLSLLSRAFIATESTMTYFIKLSCFFPN